MMLRYVYGRDQEIADAVAIMVPRVRERGFGKCRAIGVIDEEGRLIGGMVYHNWNPEAEIIEMSGAAITPRWLTRETLKHVYQFPFLQCGCQMVVMQVEAENERLLRQLASYNYTFIKVPRMFGRNKDGVLCLLTYEAWLGNKFNKRLREEHAMLVPSDRKAA